MGKPDTKKVLIVDDHADMGLSMKNFFQLNGYAVDVAMNGPDAVKLAGEKEYTVVVSDLVMESMDGVDVIQKIKLARPGTLFFIMTAYPSEKRIQDAMDAGVIRIFKKPFSPMEMCKVIEEEVAKLRG
ncbi:MAG TPA: response regulator [bacterium]|nr:response regulator [bacterium]